MWGNDHARGDPFVAVRRSFVNCRLTVWGYSHIVDHSEASLSVLSLAVEDVFAAIEFQLSQLVVYNSFVVN